MVRERNIAVFLWILSVLLVCLRAGQFLFSSPYYDDQRDLLVASHIAKFREWPVSGPFSAGGLGILRYTVIPYLVYGLVYALVQGPHGMLLVWGGIASLLVPLTYLVLRRIYDRWTALVVTGALLIHPGLPELTGVMFTPHLAPLFITLWFTAMTIPMPVVPRLLLGMLSIFGGLIFHMSALAWVPIALAWWISVFVYAGKERPVERIWALVIAFGFALFGAWWLGESNALGILSVSPRSSMMSGTAFVTNIADTWAAATSFFVRTDVAFVRALCAGIVLTGFVFMAIRKENRAALRWAMGGLVFTLTVLGIYGGPILAWYHFVLVPFMLLTIAAAVSGLARYRPVRIILPVLLLVFAVVRLSAGIPIRGVYGELSEIADTVHASTASGTYRIYFVKHAPWAVFDEWESGGLWYLLEEQSGKRLVRLSGAAHSFTPLSDPVSTVFVVCDQRVIDLYSPPDRCSELMSRLGDGFRWNSWVNVYGTDPFIVAKAELPGPLGSEALGSFMERAGVGL